MYNEAPEAGIASLLASRGRKGDSMLVHMAPEEVQGLQSLAYAAGGQLSINPVTGLYEANFLKKLLPTILGFGLNFMFPGLGALGSAALVGAGETVRTGGDLGKGLMAGLGAFGGASLGAGLSAAGGKAAEATAGGFFSPTGGGAGLTSGASGAGAAAETAKQGMFALNPNMSGTLQSYGRGITNLGTEAGRTAFMDAIPGGKAGVIAGGMGLANAFTPDVQFPDPMGQIDDSYYESEGYDPATGRFRGGRWRKGYPGFPPLGMAEGGDVPPPAPSYDTSLADYMSQLNQFVTSPVAAPRPQAPPPPAAVAPPGSGGSDIAGGGAGRGAGGGGMYWDNERGHFVRGGPGTGGAAQNTFNIGPFDFDMGSGFGNLNFGALQNYLQGGSGGEMRWDADQGRFVSGAPAAAQPDAGTVYAGGTPGFYDQGIDPYAEMSNQMAGLGGLNQVMYRQGGNVPPMQYAAGGKYLQGPGDGMSDDIKANINGQQEARLADGEFVIPADVVSHLGNGSSNAGSRKLYDMMAKVRQARTGTEKQAPAVKVNKYIPNANS